MSKDQLVNRRDLIRGSLAATATMGVGGLAACAVGPGSDDDNTGTGSGNSSESAAAPMSPDNPFNIADDSPVEAIIFDGGYGIDYVEHAVKQMNQEFDAVKVTVKSSTDIAGELQPRFVAGEPPDLIDNSGAKSIGWGTILEQLEELDDVFEAPNYEGVKIADTLVTGPEAAKAPGRFGGKFVALNYVLTIYAVWYSASLFDEHGWTPPTTWDEAIELGRQAKSADKYLFCWGREAATYYQTLAIDSAIKQGGDEVRLALENLEENCWSHPAVQEVLNALGTIVSEGMVQPGGSGTYFTAAQAQWSERQESLLYPSGSWIENEMKKQTKEGFDMKGVPTFVLDNSSQLPAAALHSAAGEPYCVPKQAKNGAGGKELLRAMLSKEAAMNFAKTKLAPTIVKDTVPEDGFGSTALVSQSDMLAAAGSDVFTHSFVNLYGMNQNMLVEWNSFLDGATSVAELTEALQEITDAVRNDPNVEKVTVE